MKYITYIMAATIVFMQVLAHSIVHFATNQDETAQIAATNYYMLCDAICWVIAFGIIAMMASGLFRQLMTVVALLWVGKVIDELFYDPTALSWNDLLMFNIAQVYAVFVITKFHLKKHK
jgi:hypothetical protein